MPQGSERDISYFAPSRAFGASDRLPCPACSGTMTISRRTPVVNLPNLELQTFSSKRQAAHVGRVARIGISDPSHPFPHATPRAIWAGHRVLI
jgi:hypothetical protein